MTYDTYGHWLGRLDDDHAKFAAGELEITAARIGSQRNICQRSSFWPRLSRGRAAAPPSLRASTRKNG
jgi:hypothetical protein